MSAWGSTTDLVLLTLAEHGRATLFDIATEHGLNVESVRKVLNRMVAEPLATRRAHVADWLSHFEGQRTYPRPVYAPGAKPNKRKPARKPHSASTRERCQRAQRLLAVTPHGHMPQKQAAKIVAAMRRQGVFR